MKASGAADVLVVGAGGAGLVAAAVAADCGARVIQFEKTDRIGGCWLPGIGNAGSVSGAQTIIQFENGIFDDSPYRFYADCMSEPRVRAVCSPEVLGYYCRYAGVAVDWLDRLGAFGRRERRPKPGLFGEAWSVNRSYYLAPDFLTVVASFHRRRVERGDILLMTGARVVSLVIKDGSVRGVIVVRRGAELVYYGKA
ncbi:MAG: FAD-binding protein, partial [Dehalococcoidia bacterium]|nr:FAD-binding protein [Dehalococcoidia bacterium]